MCTKKEMHSTQLVINYWEKTTFTVQVSEHILGFRYVMCTRVYLSVPKSGGTVHRISKTT